jgi:stearoyl-CoA desaturase (delta-9 desaturase)
MGWICSKHSNEVIEGQCNLDYSDLEKDPILKLDAIYPITSLTMSFILPTCIAGYYWNDYYGGLFYAGIIRTVIVHHMTFFINSLAHWKPMGKKTYNTKITPVDSPPLALLTLGEGYHNYHHTYPRDYRNGKKWYQLDPTKWFIWTNSLLGLAYDLHKYD